MNNLDMIKAFAELECVDVEVIKGEVCAMNMDGSEYLPYAYYNPITDLALAMNAVIDYEVNINPKHGTCYPLGHISSMAFFDSDGNGNLPHAVIKCILKSKGKWV